MRCQHENIITSVGPNDQTAKVCSDCRRAFANLDEVEKARAAAKNND